MKVYPLAHAKRTYPLSASGRVYPSSAAFGYFMLPGNSSKPILGEQYYPFGTFELGYPSGTTLSSIQYRLSGASAWTTVSAGAYSDVEEATRFVALEASAFADVRNYQVQASFTASGTAVLLETVSVPTLLELTDYRICASGQTIKPFANARFAVVSSPYVASIEYSVSGVSAIAKTAILKPVLGSGTHNTGTSISLINTTADFSGIRVAVGDIVHVATGATMPVAAISTTVNTGDTLSGTLSSGSFTSGTQYTVREELNLVGMANRWDYQFNTSGVYVMTLYVTDTDSNESSDSLYVRVS